MEISISEQLVCSLASLIYGCVVSCAYDLLTMVYLILGISTRPRGILPKVVKHTIRAVLDFLFCVIAGAGFSVLLYAFFYGRPRLVFILSCIAGFALYRVTLSRPVLQLFGLLHKMLKAAVAWVLKIILTPILWPIRFVLRRLRRVLMRAVAAYVTSRRIRRDIKRVNKIISEEISDIVRI